MESQTYTITHIDSDYLLRSQHGLTTTCIVTIDYCCKKPVWGLNKGIKSLTRHESRKSNVAIGEFSMLKERNKHYARNEWTYPL